MGYYPHLRKAAFAIKSVADLCALAQRPAGPGGTFETVVTVTATDGEGASVSTEIVGTTAYACGPLLATASVDGQVLTLTFDEALDEDSEPAPADFAVTAAGNSLSVTDVDVSGSTVELTLASAVGEGETVTVSYTSDAEKPIRLADGTGGPVESFTDQAVDNVTGEPPVLEDAVVHSTTLALLYDEPLDQNSVPATTDFTVTAAGTNTLDRQAST